MQTFLPYPDFALSAEVLDDKRLGKQRVEVLQILNTLSGRKSGWANHPAVRMWKGYEGALVEYGLAVCQEWKDRGFNDTCAEKIGAIGLDYPDSTLPPWFGWDNFHASHRANLLRKSQTYYGQFGWVEEATLEYVWPV